jgi:hypothetical protein
MHAYGIGTTTGIFREWYQFLLIVSASRAAAWAHVVVAHRSQVKYITQINNDITPGSLASIEHVRQSSIIANLAKKARSTVYRTVLRHFVIPSEKKNQTESERISISTLCANRGSWESVVAHHPSNFQKSRLLSTSLFLGIPFPCFT